MTRIKLAAAVIFALAPAIVQAQAPVNIVGSVATFQGSTLSVTPEGGGMVETYTVGPRLLVLQNRKVTLADIKPSDFVASAAMRGVDGKLHSTEVRIFPEALRGSGEGQRPMDETRTMTNATVTGTAIADGSNRLTVTFPGGQSELIVDASTPVTRIEAVDRAAIKPGMKVRVQVSRGAESAVANRITILD